MYRCVPTCLYYMHVVASRSQRGFQCPETGVTGCELPRVGAGTQAQSMLGRGKHFQLTVALAARLLFKICVFLKKI